MRVGQSKKEPLIPSGEKPEIRVKETVVVSERSYMGVRYSWRYLEFLYGCKRPVEISKIYLWV